MFMKKKNDNSYDFCQKSFIYLSFFNSLIGGKLVSNLY